MNIKVKNQLSEIGINNISEIVYNPSYDVLYEEENDKSLLGFEKLSNTTIKKLQKGKRQRKIGTNVTPSGFHKKKQISEELATFLNVANDTKMARTDVTKLLSAYIREKQLQNPDNRKFIIPDEKLTSLLRIKPDISDLHYNDLCYSKD